MIKKSTIKKLQSDLERDEGKKNKIYLDTEGLKTVGIGHLITKFDAEYGKPVGYEISDQRINELFEKDVKSCLYDCQIVFPKFADFHDELQLIIANMMFNLGRLRFLGFRRMIVHIDNQNYRAAAEEMEDSKWFRQVKNRAKRLQKRMIALANCNVNEATI